MANETIKSEKQADLEEKLASKERNRKYELEAKLKNHVFKTIIDGEVIFAKIEFVYHSCGNDWGSYSYHQNVSVLSEDDAREYVVALERRLKELKGVV